MLARVITKERKENQTLLVRDKLNKVATAILRTLESTVDHCGWILMTNTWKKAVLPNRLGGNLIWTTVNNRVCSCCLCWEPLLTVK